MKGRGVGRGIGKDGSFLGDGEYGIDMCRSLLERVRHTTFAGLSIWSLGEWGHGMVFSLSDMTEITPSLIR